MTVSDIFAPSSGINHFHEKNGDNYFNSCYTRETQEEHNYIESTPAPSSLVDFYAGTEHDASSHRSYDSGAFLSE
jgi:hypothetical protein